MQIVMILVGVLTGVLIYRLGRHEGEAGRVLPMLRPRKEQKKEDELLRKIESYKGK